MNDNEENKKLCSDIDSTQIEFDNHINIATCGHDHQYYENTHSNCNHDHNHEHNHEHDHDDHNDHNDHNDDDEQILGFKDYIQEQDIQFKELIFHNDYKYSMIISLILTILGLYAFLNGLYISNSQSTQVSFDCFTNAIIIFVGCSAGIIAKCYKPSNQFPFGMQRLEYLSALTLSIHIVIVSIFHLSRNIHEILDDFKILNFSNSHQDQAESMFYPSIRILISFYGLLQLVDYINLQQIDFEQQKQTYINNYRGFAIQNNDSLYISHFVNMHAICMVFLTELLLNFGTFLEFILDNALNYPAMGSIIVVFTIFIIYMQIKPLIITTTYVLLLASQDHNEKIRGQLKKFDYSLITWGHPQATNAIINVKNGTKKEMQQILGSKFKQCYIQINK